MLSRRFARCSREVKITLFKTYSQTLYTCNLWSSYTKEAFSALRIQYNNAFRGLLGLPSGMFADSGTDGFHAVLCKRVASLWERVRGSTNTLLKVVADKTDGPTIAHWVATHFPWLAHLGYNKPFAVVWGCGGALLSNRHVLTAGHCIYGFEDQLFVVRLGDIAQKATDIFIKKLILHEHYGSKTFENDIGLLILAKTVLFTDIIKPICLPRSKELISNSFLGEYAIVAGWGRLTTDDGPQSTVLRYVGIPVISTTSCQKVYNTTKLVYVDDRNICAGYKQGGKDSCKGDSGSPLIHSIWHPDYQEYYYYHIGLVTFGASRCGLAGIPAVFTRTTAFVPWIEEQLLGPPKN